VSVAFLSTKGLSKEELEQGRDVAVDFQNKEFSVQEYVEGCISLVSEDPIKWLGLNGGELEANRMEKMILDNISYPFICSEIPDYLGCINRLLFRSDMESVLEQYIKPRMDACINLSSFREKGYVVENTTLVVDVGIGFDDVIVRVHFPIRLSIDGTEQLQEDFVKIIPYPLGKAFALAVDIINQEIQEGHFDQLRWMKEKGGDVFVSKRRVYPHILYSLVSQQEIEYRLCFSRSLGKFVIRRIIF